MKNFHEKPLCNDSTRGCAKRLADNARDWEKSSPRGQGQNFSNNLSRFRYTTKPKNSRERKNFGLSWPGKHLFTIENRDFSHRECEDGLHLKGGSARREPIWRTTEVPQKTERNAVRVGRQLCKDFLAVSRIGASQDSRTKQ